MKNTVRKAGRENNQGVHSCRSDVDGRKGGQEGMGAGVGHETAFPLQTCYKDPALSECSYSSALGKYLVERAKRVAALLLQ